MRPPAGAVGMVVVLALLGAPLGGHAQDAPPKRPKLPAGADSNDVESYLAIARHEVESDPGVSSRAFYWAARLQPDRAEAYYGRIVAQMLDDHDLLSLHFDGGGNEKERKKDRQIDSVYALAFSFDPFLVPVWDKALRVAYIEMRMHGDGSAVQRREIEEELSKRGPGWKAWLFYVAGQYRQALDFYSLVSRSNPKDDYLLARRAELHFRLLESDSALKYYAEAVKVANAAQANQDRLVRFYKPKAVYEYMTGFVHESRGNVAAAREAYGRSLTEDLSLFVGHQRLGLLALAAADTASAISELRLGTEIAPNNAVLRFQYAAVLTRAGRLPEAVPELKRVIESEPWFADPYLLLARLYDASELHEDARTLYRGFLSRSRRTDSQRAFAADRLATLGSPVAPPAASDH